MKNSVNIQVRFSDIDSLGHVNNSVYLNYFEMARVEFFTPLLGHDWDWSKQGVILRKNEVEYLRPVLLHQKPEIIIYTKSIGTKSFILEYELKIEGEIYTIGSSVLVCFNLIENRSIDIPLKMREILESFYRTEN
jgi:acyl-CoA thioester hydrolase